MDQKNYLNLSILILAAAFLVQCSMYKESPKNISEKYQGTKPYDIIIVPGYPHAKDNWDRVVQMRLMWAKHLYEKGYTKNIMFSGAAVYSPYIESKVMARYAEAMGIPKDAIFTEENAKHSTENLYYSYVRAKELGFERIALASDPFQTTSLSMFRKKYKIDVGLLPVVFKTLKELDHTQPKIDASDLKLDTFVSIKEKENFWKRLQGTFGQQIRFRAEDIKSKKIKKRLRKKNMLIEK